MDSRDCDRVTDAPVLGAGLRHEAVPRDDERIRVRECDAPFDLRDAVHGDFTDSRIERRNGRDHFRTAGGRDVANRRVAQARSEREE